MELTNRTAYHARACALERSGASLRRQHPVEDEHAVLDHRLEVAGRRAQAFERVDQDEIRPAAPRNTADTALAALLKDGTSLICKMTVRMLP